MKLFIVVLALMLQVTFVTTLFITVTSSKSDDRLPKPDLCPVTGQLPRSVDVVCDGDLVDRCKPGDRVQLVGTYRCLPGKQNGFTSGTFRTILIANNVSLLSKEASPTITADDVKLCRKFCKAKRVRPTSLIRIVCCTLCVPFVTLANSGLFCMVK